MRPTAVTVFVPPCSKRNITEKSVEPYQEGDPVGCGEVYLPDEHSRKCYGDALRREFVETLAVRVLNAGSLYNRRTELNRVPDGMRESVEARVRELWKSR